MISKAYFKYNRSIFKLVLDLFDSSFSLKFSNFEISLFIQFDIFLSILLLTTNILTIAFKVFTISCELPRFKTILFITLNNSLISKPFLSKSCLVYPNLDKAFKVFAIPCELPCFKIILFITLNNNLISKPFLSKSCLVYLNFDRAFKIKDMFFASILLLF